MSDNFLAEEGERRGIATVEEKNKHKKRRLRKALFLSSILSFVSVSVYALTPEQEGGDGYSNNIKNNHQTCSILLAGEFLKSFGGISELEIDQERSFLSFCDQLEALPSPNTDLALDIKEMVLGYPIESMSQSIAQYDREIAGLLVGIAKKESNWGKRSPKGLNGEDCFNYWGYKGAGSKGIAMGHGCFGSKEEAVSIVGDRLKELASYKTARPEKMIIWKCGSSCDGHSKESVLKWISDVSIYYQKIVQS